MFFTSKDFLNEAKQIIFNKVKDEGKVVSHSNIDDIVYVVWYCWILENQKCLISTTIPDGKYYEITYNKERNEMYVDTYVRTENIKVEL